MVANIVNNISLSPQDIATIANALKPDTFWTIIAATIPAYITAYLYFIQRINKIKDDKKIEDDKKIKDLNILLLNLLLCVEDQIKNLKKVKEQDVYKDQFMNNPRFLYATAERANVNLIKDISLKIVMDLPEVSYELNKLEAELYWVKEYRRQRNDNADMGYEFYIMKLNKEKGEEILLLKILIPMILIVYDYATFLFPKKRILKITEKDYMSDTWEYLLNDPDFNETKPFFRFQYSDFNSPAIKEWFFKTLKNAYLENCKKDEENKSRVE